MIKNKRRWQKGEMSKTIVVLCVRVLIGVLIWAVALTTLAAVFDRSVDVSAVLTFAASAFGGELLLLAFKRVFAKKNEGEESV